MTEESFIGYRLSPQQERLWKLQRECGPSPFRVQCAVLLDMELDVARLRSALGSALARHEILRSTFRCLPATTVPLQVLGDHHGVELEVEEEAGDASRQGLPLEEAFLDMLRSPWAPERGSALAARLVKLGASRHLLMLASPALYLDELGLRNLVCEIGRGYARQRGAVEGADEPVQYADLAEWQNELLEAEGEGASFWRGRQAPDPGAPLPFQRQPRDAKVFAPRQVRFVVEAERLTALEELAREQGGTMADLLLAAWNVLLFRLTGDPEPWVAVAFDGRHYEGLEEALGLFVRYLPVRAQLEPEMGFAQAIRKAQRSLAEVQGWQEYFRWDRLAGWDADDRQEPFFLPFGFEHGMGWERSIAGFPFRLERRYACVDRFELKLSCLQAKDRLALEIHYDAAWVPEEEAQRLAQRLDHLLERVLAEPAAAVGELEVVAEAERHWLLCEVARGRDERLPDRCLHELIEEQARRTPERIAVTTGETSLTYGELAVRSRRLAGRLRRMGAGPEVRVAVCTERSPELVIGLLGVLAAGGAYVPLEPSYPHERLAWMVEDARPAVLLGEHRLLRRLAASGVPTLALEEDLAGAEPAPPPTASGLDGLAYVLYTSGSTGRPKGVMVSHGAILNRLLWMQRALPLDRDGAVLLKTPFSFDASIWELFVPLLAGARLVLARPGGHRDSSYLVETVAAEGVTTLQLVPSLLRVLVEEPGLGACRSLRRVFCGGEALPADLRARLASHLQAELHNLYGPTECAIDATHWPCLDEGEHAADAGLFVPIGHPIDNACVYLLDPRQRPVPAGSAGELYVGGRGLARGYLGRPDLTAERFVPDPFGGEPGARLYRTGDLARHLPGGALSFLSRADQQVKIRGFRIEPGEVEAVLGTCPWMREAVVVPREVSPGEFLLAAYVVVLPDGEPGTEPLRSYLAQRLPEHMVPGSFTELPELPRLPSGKVDRRALSELAPSQVAAEPGSVAPLSPVDEILAGLFATALQRHRIGLHDDFFALGGHSLLATQVASRIRESFRIELPLRLLFDAPMVARLGRSIEELMRAGAGLSSPPIVPVPRDRDLPLSYAQQRLWWITQLAPESPAYNLSFVVELSARIEPALLDGALRELVRRHEALRTRILTVDGRPFQRIVAAPDSVLSTIDLRALPSGTARVESHRLMEREAKRPFDLARGPLVRGCLLLGEVRSEVLFTLHHIVSDAWSMGVLVREVAALYEAFSRAVPSPLPELAVHYADFAVWQREWLHGPVLETLLGFWRRRLAGAPRVLDLPTDRPRPSVQTFRGTYLSSTLGGELSAALQELSRERRATLFMTLFTAFQILLSRYSGQRDLLLGTPIANRNRAEIEGLIGFFVNSLVLRADLHGDPTLGELLDAVRTTTLDAYAHQDLPFERLVQELDPERSLGHSPLFQVMFVLQNAPIGNLELSGQALAVRPLETGAVQFDLILSAAETRAGLLLSLGYNSDLFDEVTALRLHGHLGELLRWLPGALAAPVAAAPLLTGAERHQLTVEWSAAASRRPAVCVPALFAAQARRTPAVIALELAGRTLTYRELDERANGLAHTLRRLGVGPEVRVGVCVDRSLETVVAILGVLKSGGAGVLLDPEAPRERLAWMLEDSGAAVLITTSAQLPGLSAAGPRPVLLPAEAPPAEAAPAGETLAETLAYLIYTSGTTGRPKAVAVEHGHLAHTLTTAARTFGFGDHDAMLHLAPFSFDISLFELLLPLISGATCLVLPRQHVLDLPRLAGSFERVTRAHAVPSLMRQVVGFLRDGGRRLERLETVFVGGEAVPPELLRDMEEVFPAARRVVLYGPTEGTIICSSFAVPGGETLHSLLLGRPLTGNALLLLDDRGRPVPVGVPGEVCLGGPGIARGYLGRPDLTAGKFIPYAGGAAGARLYRTGDLARHRLDGNLEFLGRIDDQVKVRGFRIEPGEVEAALAGHPAISHAAVVARRDGTGGDRLVAYAVPAGEKVPTLDELRSFLAERLPEYAVPSAFVVLDRLPLTAHGKVDRRALPSPGETGLAPEAEHVVPRTAREVVLADIWAQTLGRERVGIRDNFFALGGDSILGIQLIARANQRGFRLTPADLFRCQTVAELAALAPAEPVAVVDQEAVTGEVPLTPIQRAFFAEDLADPHHHNQSVLLALRERPAAALLHQALAHLLLHHDALRLRFERRAGEWHQRCASPAGEAPFTAVDLSALPPAVRRSALEQALAAAQGSLELQCGPLLRAVLLVLGAAEPHRLLLAAHHLAVDGVSWRILLEDLESAYRSLERGESVSLPAKTTSFQHWARRLREHARSAEIRAQLDRWLAAGRERILPLPVDGAREDNIRGDARTLTVSLDPTETTALLEDVHRAYRMRIDEVLLAALGQAFASWTGVPLLWLDLEGHGREPVVGGLDLSRTVGWFTAVYPVLLDLRRSAGPGESLRAVKEQLRAVPGKGLGYGLLRYLGEGQEAEALRRLPRTEVSFNYLGQLDRVLPAGSPFAPAPEAAGSPQSPHQKRGWLLDVTASVAGGRLHVGWTYGEKVHRRAGIERLAGAFVAALRDLIAHCSATEAGVYTPSDFPLARIDQPALERLTAGGADIEDIYPQSPLQQGLFFHTLYTPGSGAYVLQLTCTLQGDLDVAAFQRAWRHVVDRQPVLRTAFASEGLKAPLQIVHRRVSPPWEEMDWCALPAVQQRLGWEAFLEGDRRRGFDPLRCPLMRLTLIRFADDVHEFVWTTHHLLLDAWCLSLILRELLEAYDACRLGREPVAHPVRPYRDYIEWLGRRDQEAAKSFWRRTLDGFTSPTYLCGRIPSPGGVPDPATQHRLLSPEATARLQELAKRHHLTLSTLTHAALALLLAHHTGADDVLFGCTVSGRPADLPGAASMLGLFINSLPVRVKVSPERSLLPWLQELQEQQAEAREHEHSPLVDVQAWSGMAPGVPLFDTILSYQNYPVDRALSGRDVGLHLRDVRARSLNDNPLTILAALGTSLSLEALYDRHYFTDRLAAMLLSQLEWLLDGFGVDPEVRLSALLDRLAQLTRRSQEAEAEAFAQTTRERLRSRARRGPAADRRPEGALAARPQTESEFMG